MDDHLRTVIVDRPPTSTQVFATTLYEDGKLTPLEYRELMALYQEINGEMSTVDQTPWSSHRTRHSIGLPPTLRRCLETNEPPVLHLSVDRD